MGLINRVKKFRYDLPFSHNISVMDDDRQTTHRTIDVLQQRCSYT